jgi:hypothetical protein
MNGNGDTKRDNLCKLRRVIVHPGCPPNNKRIYKIHLQNKIEKPFFALPDLELTSFFLWERCGHFTQTDIPPTCDLFHVMPMPH